MSVLIDLSRLPPPDVVERLSYEDIFAALVRDLLALDPSFSALVESDPAIKLLQVVAARELLLRQRINDAARANLLAFAGKGDLDQLAAFYGVSRLAGEDDAALRLRVQQRIQGWANAGGAAHYRYWALTASPQIRDAAVSSPAPGQVRIAVLSRSGSGQADDALLQAVRAVVTSDDVRVLTDDVAVVSALIRPVDVAARLWLYPDVPEQLFGEILARLPTALEQARGLGWDVTRSWLIAQLHAEGVHRVELDAPAADVTCGADECAALGNLAITLVGRGR